MKFGILLALAVMLSIIVCGVIACGSNLSNDQFPCDVVSIAGLCAVPSPTPVP
jgi:hypothetical protein